MVIYWEEASCSRQEKQPNEGDHAWVGSIIENRLLSGMLET